MPRNEDLTLPTITGQTPYDVEVSIDRLRDYSLNLAALQDAVAQRLAALASEVAGTQAVLAQQEADKAGLLVAALASTEITADGVTIPDAITDLLAAAYATVADESALLPNSRQLLAGTGITFDDTVANARTIAAAAAAAWGSIIGTLSDQTDLQTALDAKQDTLVFDAALCAYVIPL